MIIACPHCGHILIVSIPGPRGYPKCRGRFTVRLEAPSALSVDLPEDPEEERHQEDAWRE